MTLLWTIEDLVAAMTGRPVGTMPPGITGISIDSRSIQPGEVFSPSRATGWTGMIMPALRLPMVRR